MSSSQIDPAARAALLVPQSTRDNYVNIVRRAAVARGISVSVARAQQVKNWRAQHDADPLGGWDVLADWLDSAELAFAGDIAPADLAKARALESAKRDPSNPQAAILDMSDAEVRDQVDAARNALADGASSDAPVITDDGAEVPANRVQAVLSGDEKPTPPPSTAPAAGAKSPK